MTDEELKFEREKWQVESQLEREKLDLEKEKWAAERNDKPAAGRLWKAAGSPIFLALVGILGAGVGAILQGYTAVRAEREKLRSTLILKAFDTADEKDAIRFLAMLRDTKLVKDIEVVVQNYAKNPDQIPLRQEEPSAIDRSMALATLREASSASIEWFMKSFGEQAKAVVAGTPFSPELLAAIAYAETGHVWSALKDQNMPPQEILNLCVSDTLDAPLRNAWPKNKAALLTVPQGNEMFVISRDALERLAKFDPKLATSVTNPDKFCRSFGIFARDLQFFVEDPNYFLQKKWTSFNDSARVTVEGLKAAVARQGWASKTSLTDDEMVHVSIAYVKGRSNPTLGFKQGSRNSAGIFYGEQIYEYLVVAKAKQKDSQR